MPKQLKPVVLAIGLLTGFTGITHADGFSIPPPLKFNAGPLGELDVQGVLSGMGFAQTNPAGSGLNGKNFGAAISNGLISVSKPSGLVQFYLLAGAYNFPNLGEPFQPANTAIQDFTALPAAYLTIAPMSDFSVSIGQLPTLIGYTSTFSYKRMNIEGGFPWTLEPSFSRGVQANYSYGPISASVSWNDGYFSDRYNVISGLLT